MILHLWDKARDPHEWYEHHERRPVLCGQTVDYQKITRDLENVTCASCEEVMESEARPLPVPTQ